PKRERQDRDGDPGQRFQSGVAGASSKQVNQKRAAQKDRSAEASRPEVWESVNAPPGFKQHRLSVERDGVNRENAALIPRLIEHARNPRIAEIEDGIETRVVVTQRQKTQGDRNRGETGDLTPIAPSLRAVFYGVRRSIFDNQAEENGRQQNDF